MAEFGVVQDVFGKGQHILPAPFCCCQPGLLKGARGLIGRPCQGFVQSHCRRQGFIGLRSTQQIFGHATAMHRIIEVGGGGKRFVPKSGEWCPWPDSNWHIFR